MSDLSSVKSEEVSQSQIQALPVGGTFGRSEASDRVDWVRSDRCA